MSVLTRIRRALRHEPDAAPRPGWYAFPDEGIERWHDQYGWSDHTRPIEDC